MGYLALKDTGSLGLNVSSGYFTPIYQGASSNAINPSGDTYPYNKNILPLKALNLSLNTGKNIDSTSNITGSITRLGFGSTLPLSIKFSATYERKPKESDELSSITGGNILDSEASYVLSFLSLWARRKTILMLFWVPDEADNSNLLYSEVKDFYSSVLKVIYDTIWNRDSFTASSKGYNSSTYGSVHYQLEDYFGAGSNYEPSAIPIVLNSISISSSGSSRLVDVSVDGYALENEDLVYSD